MMLFNRLKIYYICIFVVVGVLLIVIAIKSNNNLPQYNTLNKRDTKKKNNKTTKHVFFDIGANNGNSINYFMAGTYETKKQPLNAYGSKSGYLWDLYLIEANPYFNNRLKALKSFYERQGHTVHLYKETAAWKSNGKIKFFLDTVNHGGPYWGSSLLENHIDVIRSNRKYVMVESIDVLDLLTQYNEDDEVIVKIDIEGAEYDLLTHLLTNGAFKLIDTIAVEFHTQYEPFPDMNNFFLKSFQILNLTYVAWL